MASDRRRGDHFSRRAKAQGKAARSVFKLEEIDQRWRIFKAGMVILDLGCAPGSWMQYAAERVGAGGRVLGYDLKAVTIALPPHAEARVGDVFEMDLEGEGPYDVVLSDMAPATMGDHATDAARSAGLAEMALALAEQHLKVSGHVVVKLLEGRDLPNIVRGMRATYHKVQRFRPKATRKDSTEIFLIGLGKRRGPGNHFLPGEERAL